LKKLLLTIFILISLSATAETELQEDEMNAIHSRVMVFFVKGDFLEAEKMLISLLHSGRSFDDAQLAYIYSSIGVLYLNLGRYDEALAYISKTDSLKINDRMFLASIYSNKGAIYENRKSYSQAIEYFEKAIRTYMTVNDKTFEFLKQLSFTYFNYGVLYNDYGNYSLALDYFRKSLELRNKIKLPERSENLVLMAKAYTRLKDYGMADRYFKEGIATLISDKGEEYLRLAPMYFAYGQFLGETGKHSEAAKYLRRALSICIRNYGKKHTLTSLAYKNLADLQMSTDNIDSALYYYQRSLIAVVKKFNDYDIFSNPGIDTALFDLRLLDNLKSKSRALEEFANLQDEASGKISVLKESLECIELALNLIDLIKGKDLSEEGLLYLAQNEKESYVFAVHVAGSLNSYLNSDTLIHKIYALSQRAKSTILRNEITGNELLYSSVIPDSLREKQNILKANIAAYNKYVLDEMREPDPDTVRINMYRDDLFEMNREREKLASKIALTLPRYFEILRKTDPVPVEDIQKHLNKDETILDYLLSSSYSGGRRKLYTFLISRDNIILRETELDSLFLKYARILKNSTDPFLTDYEDYTGALYYMYQNLISPVEELFTGKKLIVIPDEEIEWMAFEAFLKRLPEAGKKDFDGLGYLISDYTFSYGPSSSLLFTSAKKPLGKLKLYSFLPSYNESGSEVKSLSGASAELETIHSRFPGHSFTGEDATKQNFFSVIKNKAFFHLAMHLMSDSSNSRYSYMLFDERNETGKLYNYEISLARIKSPMVVLSSCNSGTGTMNSGEGLMSLARSFVLAGASSVVKTMWNVNDESSSEIISEFYNHLSKGKKKDDALRLSKLEYLKKATPAFKHPYYWAAYEVLGDTQPVCCRGKLISVVLIVIISAGLVFYYFRRRKIFSDRSLK
jgi:CHAT domain-containing protein/Tfp pilus assembly protein PilF